jgi:hypothetical protein
VSGRLFVGHLETQTMRLSIMVRNTVPGDARKYFRDESLIITGRLQDETIAGTINISILSGSASAR